jgi:SynChlorMet cassette radical SAM/SPASM protein ScmF
MPCEVEEAAAAQAIAQTAPALDLPEGVPPLTSLYLYIAGTCNLACRHCWITPTYQPDGNGGQYVKLEHVRKAIREAKPLGLRSIKLTGGEPTLHPQFRALVTLIDEAGLNIIIETNGTLVDGALARFLKDTPHVSFISVSVDGATAETHEAMRLVPGSYESALAGIKALVEVGFRPQLICTLHRGNVSQIAEVVALAESLGCGSVKFNHVQRVGRGERFADDHGLEVAEIIQLYRRVESELVPRSKVRIHFDIPFAFYPIRKLLSDSLGRCRVTNILGVLAGGGLSLCGIGVTVPELIYGHLENDGLREVWCNSPGLIRLREQIPAQLEGVCGQCLHRNMCLGTCVANNYHAAGKLNAPYRFCDHAEMLGLFPESRREQPTSKQRRSVPIASTSRQGGKEHD